MDVQDQMKLAKVIAEVNAIHEAEKAALRAEVEALLETIERMVFQVGVGRTSHDALVDAYDKAMLIGRAALASGVRGPA